MTIAFFVIVALGIVLVAAFIYPGELSHVSSRLNRKLYDRAARNYDRKWRAEAYRNSSFDRAITDFSVSACRRSGVQRVLDLGCGTGRGIRLIAEKLPPTAEFVGVDSSTAMLGEFETWLQQYREGLADRVTLTNSDLGVWAQEVSGAPKFGLVLLLEVGEFLPKFASVIHRAADITADGGGFILTRPAGYWWLFFPGRMQSRRALSQLLTSSGFASPTFMRWRSRYELVFCQKN